MWTSWSRTWAKGYLSAGRTAKAYPCHSSFHAVIEGVQKFRTAHEYKPSDVHGVRITGGHSMMEARFCNRKPDTILGAQYSLPWATALALTRDVSAPEVWRTLDFGDVEVGRIASTMELLEDSARFSGPVAEVALTLAGTDYSLLVKDWKGAPTNPYTFDEMADKLNRYAADSLPLSRTNELVERVAALEKEPDMGNFAGLIRG